MNRSTVTAAALAVVLAAQTNAQEFSGGEIGLEYNLNASGTNDNTASYNAGVEFAFGREYAIGVTAQNLDIDDASNNLTLHGIYHVNRKATVGLFYSRDEDDVQGYGIEGGTILGSAEIGGYVGQRSLESEDVMIVGFESRTKVSDQVTFFTDFDMVSDDRFGAATSELGMSYAFEQGPEAYVQVGRASVFGDDIESDSETYIGVGARITFGAKRGSTFESR